MDMSKFLGGNYLRKEDVDQRGTDLCISHVMEEEVGEDNKPCIHWTSNHKPMALNKTNTRILMAAFGNDSRDWAGKWVNVYNDLTVVFNGAVGGLRIRPRQAVPSPANVAQNAIGAVTGASYAEEQAATAASLAAGGSHQPAQLPADDIPF